MPVMALLCFGGKLCQKCWSTAFRLRRASAHRCSNCDYSSRHSPSDESRQAAFYGQRHSESDVYFVKFSPIGQTPVLQLTPR